MMEHVVSQIYGSYGLCRNQVLSQGSSVSWSVLLHPIRLQEAINICVEKMFLPVFENLGQAGFEPATFAV